MAIRGFNAQLYVVNQDGSRTPVRTETSIALRDFPEAVLETAYPGELTGTISEGFRKSMYFYLHYPRRGHVPKRGPWHQRLPPEYLTRKERRRLRRGPWEATHEGLKHITKAQQDNRRWWRLVLKGGPHREQR